MSKTAELLNKFKQLNKTQIMCILAAAIGAVMMLFSSGSDDAEPAAQTTTLDEAAYNEQYIDKLQGDLHNVLSKIDGVGEAEVLVSLQSGVRYEYATEQKSSEEIQTKKDDNSSSSDSESVFVLLKVNGDDEPILLQRHEPVVQGVVVVCDGADKASVCSSVTDAVSTICGIGSNRVSVIKKSS